MALRSAIDSATIVAAAAAEMTGKPGTVMARTLDRPHTSSRRVLSSEPERLHVPARRGRYRPLRDHRARRGNDHREHVLVPVRIDTNDVIHLICQHPSDPPIPLVGPLICSSDLGGGALRSRQLPLPDCVGQVGHPLRRLRADRLQGHAARVHALEQADSGAEQHG